MFNLAKMSQLIKILYEFDNQDCRISGHYIVQSPWRLHGTQVCVQRLTLSSPALPDDRSLLNRSQKPIVSSKTKIGSPQISTGTTFASSEKMMNEKAHTPIIKEANTPQAANTFGMKPDLNPK